MYSVFLQKVRKSLAFIFIFTFLCSFVLPVGAATGISLDQEASVSLQYKLGDIEFSLYRVADVSAGAVFTLTGDFASYQVTVNGLDSDGWRALGETLSGYVSRDNVTPLMSGKTDSSGNLTFSKLPVGLYLLIGKSATVDEVTYVPTPQMISLPTVGENDTWNYSPTLTLKYRETRIPDDDYMVPTSLKVMKIWNDEGNESKRPASVEVELLQDGEVYDTQVLNKDNNWTYTWEDLSASYDWQVVEKEVPESYNVTSVQEDGECVVTNTYLEDENMVPDPSDSTSSTRTNESESNSSNERLPQTGQLWWPVSILAFAGIISLGAGLIQRKRA